MSSFKKIIILTAFLLIPSGANCYELEKNVVEFKLSNGMRWLLVSRKQAPVFSGVVMVRVGGVDEEPGKTGLAHMFEHMAFKGSSRLGTKDWAKEKPILDLIEKTGRELTLESQKESPDQSLVNDLSRKLAELENQADAYRAKNEIWEVLARNGAADLNAFTSKDVTAYHASMPSNRFELWASVISEMVFRPAFREFYTERSVVAEERRSGVDNNPDGLMSEKVLSTAFGSGPYSWSTIGFERDVLGLTIEDARKFHSKYYVPGNMVGAIVGDISPAAAKVVLEKTFGKNRAKPLPASPKGDLSSTGGACAKLAFEAEPSLAIAWIKPTLPDPDEYAFDLIFSLLCDGRSSRLKKRLVYDKRIAEEIYCSSAYPGSRLDNLFLLWIDPMKSASPKAIIGEISSEIARLREEPVGEEEFDSARKRVTASLVFSLEDNMTLARQLAQFEAVFGNWRLLAGYPKVIAEVKPGDIMRAAEKYLRDDRRVVVERFRGKR